MTDDTIKHARTNCTSFEQTVEFISFPESQKREVGVEAGKTLGVVVHGEVLGAALDEDTMGRPEHGGTSIKDYEAVKIWSENQHMRFQSRAAGKAMPKIQTRWFMAWTRHLLPPDLASIKIKSI